MPIPNIYVALLFFTEDPNAIKCRTCYVPAHSSEDAEKLLRVEKFELMSRSDVFTYIQTDESMQFARDQGSPRIHWHDFETTHPPMNSFEFHNWRKGYVKATDSPAVYRRALP